MKDEVFPAENAITDFNSEQEIIQQMIFTVRGTHVMLDRDLARFYHVTTGRLNEAVKRNSVRFPEDFMFRLSDSETDNWKSQFAITNSIKMGMRYNPYAFTEEGVAQLAGVLRSPEAIQMSIKIIRAFVTMRRFLSANAGMFQRIQSLERHQVEIDHKIDHVLDCLEEGSLKGKAHVFSAGQIYEAKAFISELIGKAKRRVVLIDGYVSPATIDLLDSRNDGISAIIYTSSVGNALLTLRDQYCLQFPNKPLSIVKWRVEQHDRWLVIDDELWHCGASIKDAGTKTFGIDPIGIDAKVILNDVL